MHTRLRLKQFSKIFQLLCVVDFTFVDISRCGEQTWEGSCWLSVFLIIDLQLRDGV